MGTNGPKSQRKKQTRLKIEKGERTMKEIIVTIILAATIVITLAITLLAFTIIMEEIK